MGVKRQRPEHLTPDNANTGAGGGGVEGKLRERWGRKGRARCFHGAEFVCGLLIVLPVWQPQL